MQTCRPAYTRAYARTCALLGALSKNMASSGTTSLDQAVIVLQVGGGLGAVYFLNRLATSALREAGIDEEGREPC